MKRIALPLSLLIIFLWAILQPAEILSFNAPFMPMRKALTVLTGALALGWMSISMVLALRPIWLERAIGGLDKLFHVHKWIGIGAVFLVVTHWLLILSPRTLAAWGWIERMARRHHPQGAGGGSMMGFAKEMGEWSATLMIILGIVALVRFIPYGWFRKLHKGFPVAFLIGAFHSVFMVPKSVISTPFGIFVLLISLVGSVIAVYSLMGMIGGKRKHGGQVSSVTTTESGILDLKIRPDGTWPGHKAGQFALLTLDNKEGAHPFTIVSDWKPGSLLRFAIKPIGNYTKTLAGSVRPADTVTIEGPYGCFDFGDASKTQVWVAGGIGVAPFIARLEALAVSGNRNSNINFFYCTSNSKDATFPEGLDDLCRRAGVNLHLRIDALNGQISPDDIGQYISESCGVWFCGPTKWAKILQSALQRGYGLTPNRFHRELFEFR